MVGNKRFLDCSENIGEGQMALAGYCWAGKGN